MNSNIEDSTQIKYGAIMGYISILFLMVAGFIYTPWLISQIGLSEYGLYTLSTSIITYFVMDFGMGNTISRFIARYRAEGNENKVRDLLGITLKLYITIDVIILIVLIVTFFLLENIYIKLTVDEIEKFKVIFCISGLFSVISFPFLPLNGIFTAYGRIFALKAFELFDKVTTIIILVVCLILGYKLYAIVIVHAVMGLITHLLKLNYLTRKVNLRINFKCRSKQLLKEIFSFSAWVSLMIFSDRFYYIIAPTILGIFSDSVQIAIFAIGASIEGYTFIFANVLNGLFLPRVTNIVVKNGDKSEVTDLMIKIGRIQLLIISAIIMGMISLGKEFIYLWLGDSFSTSYYVIIILTIPCLITHTQGIAVELTYATNNIKYRALIFMAGGITCLIISCLLSPYFGAVGVATGISVSYTLWLIIVMNIFYYKKLELNIFKFLKECHFEMIIPFAISLVFGFVIQYLFPVSNLISFFIKAVIWGIIYMLLAWLMILNKNEKMMFINFITRISQVMERTCSNK